MAEFSHQPAIGSVDNDQVNSCMLFLSGRPCVVHNSGHLVEEPGKLSPREMIGVIARDPSITSALEMWSCLNPLTEVLACLGK